MSIAEQIKALEATRAAKAAQMENVAQKSVDAGETMTAEEGEQFDTLNDEIKQIDKDLGRLHSLEKLQGQKAQPVGGDNPKDASASRAGIYTPIKNTQRLGPGIEFARYAIAVAAGRGSKLESIEFARSRYPDNESIVNTLKASVSAGSTSGWGSELTDPASFTQDFIDFLRPQTIIGQMSGFKSVPFNVRVNGASSGTSAQWVGEGKAKPLTQMGFANVTLGTTKLAAISVLTDELIRNSTPSAETIVRDDLAAAIIAEMDSSFIDPTFAGTAGVSPASVSYGVEAIASAGVTPAKVRTDLKSLWSTFIAANLAPAAAHFVMNGTTALALSLMTESNGQRSFPDITVSGGKLMGVPVVVSEHVGGIVDSANGPVGNYLFLADASNIFLADDGQVTLDVSDQASLDMNNAPTGDATSGTGSSLVSLWQTNSIALRAERYVNWKKRRDSAVAYLNGVNYG